MEIRKAVFPVAGLGTRFLPATKASPKEMLPVVDKPLIQYAVEEAIEAGMKELIFITSGAKRAIEDHFDKNYELEEKLAQKNKQAMLEMVQNILPPDVNCVYVRQKEALGLGHAVLCAEHLIGDEPFSVLLADDLIDGAAKPCLAQMVDIYQYQKCGVLAVQPVSENKTDQYGIVEADTSSTVTNIVEKPKPEDAPSNLAVVGRYLFSPQIFKYLAKVKPGAGGEIQLTDAISDMIKNERMVAHRFQGKRYDCGDKLGYLEATLDYAMKHPEFGKQCRVFLKKRFGKL